MKETIADGVVRMMLSAKSHEDVSVYARELAKCTRPYKRFLSTKTEAFIFWDGSALMLGRCGSTLIAAARESYEALDAVTIAGVFD